MKEKGLLQKGDLIVSVSVKNTGPKNAKQPKRAKLELPSSVPPDSFQPSCTCRIGPFSPSPLIGYKLLIYKAYKAYSS